MSTKIVALVGSLRQGSLNRALLREAAAVAPTGLEIELLEIGDVPLYNSDVQAQGFPEVVNRLGEAIRQADGILLVTPEYNYSVSGVLKNTIDWISRLPNQPFSEKPVAIMGASMGNLGTARAQYHLRQILVFLNPYVMNRPEIMVPSAQNKFDAQGQLTDDSTREHLVKFLNAFQTFVTRVGAAQSVLLGK
ncbi:MAG: NAD(P)H-dependent oxidoreductase [Candidatus Eremiobacteraeota bacterium]|nr:NAD(P)H-dependent oxidoreductase [Candidatus Eremiobacteraeota bacterium]MCW5867014.1 NAD(P)H-dependent oxidoreductase [Candidatus Eremiobacteraeota bacterium]